MSIIGLILVGLIAGWLTGLIMKGQGYGVIADIVLGIIGAVIGGWVVSLFNLPTTYGTIGSIIVAVIGAIILVSIIRLIGPSSRSGISRV